MVLSPLSAPLLAHKPLHHGYALLPIFDLVFPQPDLVRLGSLVPTRLEGQAQGIVGNLPRALPELRQDDGLQRAVRAEMLRPVRVVGDDFANDLGANRAGRQARERSGGV